MSQHSFSSFWPQGLRPTSNSDDLCMDALNLLFQNVRFPRRDAAMMRRALDSSFGVQVWRFKARALSGRLLFGRVPASALRF